MRAFDFNSSGQVTPRPEAGTVRFLDWQKTPSRPTLTAADATGAGALVWQVLNNTNSAYLTVYDASTLGKPLFQARINT